MTTVNQVRANVGTRQMNQSIPLISGSVNGSTTNGVNRNFVNHVSDRILKKPSYNYRAQGYTAAQLEAIEQELARRSKLPVAIGKPNYSNAFRQAAYGPGSQFTGFRNAAPHATPNLPVVTSGGGGAGHTPNLPAVITGAGGGGGGSVPPNTPTGGSKGILGRIWNFVKSNKKLSIAAAVIGAVAGGIYLSKRNNMDNIQPTSNSSPVNDLASIQPNGQVNANGTYTVGAGDNLWNIARSTLIALHDGEEGYNPTDVEVLQKFEEIMTLSGLNYESGSYKVALQPGQNLKLVA